MLAILDIDTDKIKKELLGKLPLVISLGTLGYVSLHLG
jgi:hypothetical protein